MGSSLYLCCASCWRSTKGRSRRRQRRSRVALCQWVVLQTMGGNGIDNPFAVYVSPPLSHAAVQLLSHLHASLGDELTEPSSVCKLPDSAQVATTPHHDSLRPTMMPPCSCCSVFAFLLVSCCVACRVVLYQCCVLVVVYQWCVLVVVCQWCVLVVLCQCCDASGSRCGCWRCCDPRGYTSGPARGACDVV